MKQCPSCGYKPTPDDRALRRLYRKHFFTQPVLEMIQRQWIDPYRRDDVDAVRKELMRFFEMNADEFQAYIENRYFPIWLSRVNVCTGLGGSGDEFHRGMISQ